MKLSELVELRERLKTAFFLDPVLASVDDLRLNLSLVNQNLAPNYSEMLDGLIKDYRDIRSNIQTPTNRVIEIVDEINKEISSKSSHFFLNNYEEELNYEDPDNIRRVRVMYIPGQIHQDVESRINLYSDWKYPGLEIGCRDGEWTKYLVACDPLYLVDTHQDFLDKTINQYQAEYQRRLRTYLINNNDYGTLPQKQFNFVFSWNYFNYKSLETMKHTLKQVYNLLKPGGVFMFSYNNGDLPSAAAYAESYFMSYMPKSMLLPLAQNLGFEILLSRDYEPAVSWLEIRKPGELSTVKGHQALGTILKK